MITSWCDKPIPTDGLIYPDSACATNDKRPRAPIKEPINNSTNTISVSISNTCSSSFEG